MTTGSARRRAPAATVTLLAIGIAASMAAPSAAATGYTPAREPVSAAPGVLSDPIPEEQEKLREVAGAIWSPSSRLAET
ncbi:hypothetical protein ACIPM2_35950 [Streptomyces sp. NPDC086081]|uniref:hypothetical protein n=1 Tax=Streptomyces sp. NPDC086081 TaxID=3365749 RepID=UPI0038177788